MTTHAAQRALFVKVFGIPKPVIGMVHLAALPGNPGYRSRMVVYDHALRDARALREGGVDALLIENFGDTPYFPGRVPPHIVAEMTLIVQAIRREVELPVGVNVLRNDGLSALAVAGAAGGGFVRVNVLSGTYATDQGLISGEAHLLMRSRHELASPALIFADMLVKHARPLGELDPGAIARDTAHRARADALIVTGSSTGVAPSLDEVRTVRQAVPEKMILVGSGVTERNAPDFLRLSDGLIVGTDLKEEGKIENAVDAARVQRLVEGARSP